MIKKSIKKLLEVLELLNKGRYKYWIILWNLLGIYVNCDNYIYKNISIITSFNKICYVFLL